MAHDPCPRFAPATRLDSAVHRPEKPAPYSPRPEEKPTHVRDRRVGVQTWSCLPGRAPARHAAPAAPRPRRAARVGPAARTRRPRSRAAEHHRPGDRRPADRQRGREPPHRRERRVLRVREDPPGARVAGARLPHALRQRDRPTPVRGRGRPLPAPPPRRVRLRHLGRARRAALRRARPLRDQAPLLHDPRRGLPRRLRGQGLPGARGPAAVGPRHRLRPAPGPDAPPLALGLRRDLPGAAGLLPDHRRRERAHPPVLGHRLPDCRPDGLGPQPPRLGEAARERPRGVRPPAPARRRAGRLLPQRRARLLRGAGNRLADLEPAPARLHSFLRPRRLRRARARRRAGQALRRGVLPHRHPLRAHGRAPLGRGLPRRASHRERPRGGEVPAESRGARLGGQGGADRRGLRRGLRRLPLLPPRHDPPQHGGPGPRHRSRPAGAARRGQQGLAGPSDADRGPAV